MAELTIVRILWCGQGMTALVELYADGVEKTAADALVLVDCGGDWGSYAVGYVADKVLKSVHKRLDAVVISHQDKDHTQLLPDLGTKLKDQKVTVTTVFLGGLEWGSMTRGFVTTFLERVGYPKEKVQFNAPYLSHYAGALNRGALQHLVKVGGTDIRILVSGVDPGGSHSANTNGSSSIVVVDNGHWSVVLPGDATYDTMRKVNEIGNLNVLLPTVVGLELPHHGAIRTTVENYSAKKEADEFSWKIVKAFAAKLAPMAVAASAGPWNSHKHPVDEVFDIFEDYTAEMPWHGWVTFSYFFRNGPRTAAWRYVEGTAGYWSTVEAIGDVAEKSMSDRREEKVGHGPFVHRDILAKLGDRTMRPEDMIELRVVGYSSGERPGEPVTYAPAP